MHQSATDCGPRQQIIDDDTAALRLILSCSLWQFNPVVHLWAVSFGSAL